MNEDLRQQPEEVSTLAVLGSSGIVVLAIAASIAAAAWLGPRPLRSSSEQSQMSVPSDETQPVRFSSLEAPPRAVPQVRKAPDQYGWVDRGEGVIRIPVDVAMDVYLDRRAKRQP